jgi:hypothetical protein
MGKRSCLGIVQRDGESSMRKSNNRPPDLKSHFRPGLLRTESKQERDELVRELTEEIQPRGRIEREYVNDIAYLTWEIMRYRRFKTATINNAFRVALEETLRSIDADPFSLPGCDTAHELAHGWFSDEESKERALGLLEKAGLDEMAIEAQAFVLKLTEIERIDRFLVSAEVRRDKALRTLASYQESFAQKVQQSSDRVLAADAPGIVPSSSAN